MVRVRRYRYVGPAELRDRVIAVDAVAVDSLASLASLDGWLAGRDSRDLTEPVTFVVVLDGVLRLAPRRSEHVALAGGHDVLAAGEMAFAPAGTGWRVAEVTNQSTGYCPDPDCWPAVAEALDRVGLPHPGGFTDRITFRRCPTCGERNIVRDDDFTCALCGSALPARWNLTSD
ncbi:hypothetical protein [Rugosimonospora africana]|uniref:Uncharacterized protein n=1 Tax=Rugosimonospora africana TaxID=556532 RepID=A0A8J3VVM5_9ACTN|nr:hypothetical protein [Rugosimonospora africana]GIH19931.1 hypothetical protein Raf01_81030 [Rugosimonospora africana]